MDACAPYCPCKRANEYDRGPGDPDAHDEPSREPDNKQPEPFTEF